jgi:hypothetical protein
VGGSALPAPCGRGPPVLPFSSLLLVSWQDLLFWGCRYGQLAVVTQAIQACRAAGGHLAEATEHSEGRGILHWQALWGSSGEAQLQVLALLLREGLRPDEEDSLGCTALDYAAQLGHSTLLEGLQAGVVAIDEAKTRRAYAALANVSHQPGRGQPFVDPDFLPEAAHISPQLAERYAHAEWVRAADIAPSGIGEMFTGSQGGQGGAEVGPPWLWAAVTASGAAGVRAMLETTVVSGEGMYRVRIGGRTVVVDDLIPCIRREGAPPQPIFGCTSDPEAHT